MCASERGSVSVRVLATQALRQRACESERERIQMFLLLFRIPLRTSEINFCLLPLALAYATQAPLSLLINTNHYQSIPIITIHYHSLPIISNHYHSLPIITNHYLSLPWQWDCASEGLRKRGTAKARDNGTMWQWECPRGRECESEGLWNRGTAQARECATEGQWQQVQERRSNGRTAKVRGRTSQARGKASKCWWGLYEGFRKKINWNGRHLGQLGQG